MTATRRLGLAAVIAAAFATSGCAMWQGMTSRMGFGGDRGATSQAGTTGAGGATGTRGTSMPGSGMTMSGGPMNAPMPRFSSYNECRQWLATPDAARLNRGPWQGGEVTNASVDPCLRARYPG
jgi:hypothetical protein